MVESDPMDRAAWQSIVDQRARLIGAEMEHRRGRAPDWYIVDLLGMIDREDTSLGERVTRSSSSTLTETQAFSRGYR